MYYYFKLKSEDKSLRLKNNLEQNTIESDILYEQTTVLKKYFILYLNRF